MSQSHHADRLALQMIAGSGVADVFIELLEALHNVWIIQFELECSS